MKKIFSILHGPSYKWALKDLDEWARRLLKYEDINTITVETLRAKIRECLSDYGVNIED